MPSVKIKENEPFDVALRRYEKPTAVRKRQAAAAVKRHAKKVSREMKKQQRLY